MVHLAQPMQSVIRIVLQLCCVLIFCSFTQKKQEDFHPRKVFKSYSGKGKTAKLRALEETFKDQIAAKRWRALGKTIKAALKAGVSHQKLRQLCAKTKCRPFTRALQASEKMKAFSSNLALSFGELLELSLFIETELPKQVAKQGNYLSRKHTGLPRSIEYDPESKLVFIHLLTHGGVPPIGKGFKKIVTKSILYHKSHPKIVANCSSTVPMAEEINALKELQGLPGILTVHAFTERTDRKRGTTYSLLCKKYRAGTLGDLIVKKEFTLSLKQKMGLALDILKGLESLHKQHLVHRDLHLRNCLVDVVKSGKRHRFTAAIADMGRTISIDDVAGHEAQGNVYYIAPEGIFYKKMRRHDYYYSDIYAAGCSLYKLLRGPGAYWVDRKWIKGYSSPKEGRRKYIQSLKAFRAKRYRYFAKQKKHQPSPRERFERLILKMVDPVPINRGSATELRVILENIMKKSFKKQ